MSAQRSHPEANTPAEAKGPALAGTLRQWSQVMLATGLVAGLPVAVVWWLRGSGAISSPAVGLVLGMVISLFLSQVARLLWEQRCDSGDLLFSDLMLWGFLQRRYSERRLASAIDMLGPGSEERQRVLTGGLSSKEQAKLLERLVGGIETRDPYLHGHSRRVARHSWMIARRLGLSPAEVARIRTAAALHDVGKTETPRTILHKPGALTAQEYAVIKNHPADGARMVAVLRDDELSAMVRHHHERLDGSGYPGRLAGEEIPLGARIIAVADTFDAITSARPYRAASPHKKAMDILKAEAGTKLDPDVVRAFCRNYGGVRPIALWGTVAGLPERVLSWLSGSVGGIASTAKLAAVAAIVGGTAATTSAIALPVPIHSAADTHQGSRIGIHARTAPLSSGGPAAPARQAAISTTRTVASRAHHVSHAAPLLGQTASAAHPSASSYAAGAAQHTESSASGTIATEQVRGEATGKDVHKTESSAAGTHGEQTVSRSEATQTKTEAAHGKSEESPGKSEATHGKSEEPQKKSEATHGKSEESHGKGEESHGKSGEAHGKSEEAHGKSEEPHGKSEESHGKSEEPHGKSDEAHGKSEEAHGKSEESHGKSEESHGKSEEAHGKSEESHGNG